jgi:hypothetical protein
VSRCGEGEWTADYVLQRGSLPIGDSVAELGFLIAI